jgi:rubredoxin
MAGNKIILESVVTCPHCGFEKIEKMPESSCLVSYTCERCGAVLQPEQGDCCIFCSFGSQPCPPMQIV